MYLEFAKKHILRFWLIGIVIMLTAIFINGIAVEYFMLFGISFVLFSVVYLPFRTILHNSISLQTELNILVMDIGTIVAFVYSIFGTTYSSFAVAAICLCVPARNVAIFFMKKYNVTGELFVKDE